MVTPSRGFAWRQLTPDELGVLEAALTLDFPDAATYLAQLEGIMAQKGCSCGCGTIDLKTEVTVDKPEVPSSPLPLEGTIYDDDAGVTGGAVIFAKDGYLSSLEVFATGDEPLQIPSPDRIVWRVM